MTPAPLIWTRLPAALSAPPETSRSPLPAHRRCHLAFFRGARRAEQSKTQNKCYRVSAQVAIAKFLLPPGVGTNLPHGRPNKPPGSILTCSAHPLCGNQARRSAKIPLRKDGDKGSGRTMKMNCTCARGASRGPVPWLRVPGSSIYQIRDAAGWPRTPYRLGLGILLKENLSFGVEWDDL